MTSGRRNFEGAICEGCRSIQDKFALYVLDQPVAFCMGANMKAQGLEFNLQLIK